MLRTSLGRLGRDPFVFFYLPNMQVNTIGKQPEGKKFTLVCM